jgi:hypothetical protein
MIVYLWDAHGPACRRRGVSDSLGRALEAARACLVAGGASSARVEVAWLGTCARTLQPCYERTGQAWQARRSGRGAIRWEQTPAAEAPRSALEATTPAVHS